MAMLTLLLAFSAPTTPPTNPLTEYRKCLMGNRLDDQPPGSPVESMAAAITRCTVKRKDAISFLHADDPNDGEAENKANLILVEQEMSLIWVQARSRFPLSIHGDEWALHGPRM